MLFCGWLFCLVVFVTNNNWVLFYFLIQRNIVKHVVTFLLYSLHRVLQLEIRENSWKMIFLGHGKLGKFMIWSEKFGKDLNRRSQETWKLMAIAVSRENAVLVNGKWYTFWKDNPRTEWLSLSILRVGGGGRGKGGTHRQNYCEGRQILGLNSSPQFLSDTFSTKKVECVINFWTG